jgi:hypothetical protein
MEWRANEKKEWHGTETDRQRCVLIGRGKARKGSEPGRKESRRIGIASRSQETKRTATEERRSARKGDEELRIR